jgi:hypothetical protein
MATRLTDRHSMLSPDRTILRPGGSMRQTGPEVPNDTPILWNFLESTEFQATLISPV